MFIANNYYCILIIFISLFYIFDKQSDQLIGESLFGTIAILTGTGYVLGDYELWPVFLQLILLTLMFIEVWRINYWWNESYTHIVAS